jgi:hypothetical protein
MNSSGVIRKSNNKNETDEEFPFGTMKTFPLG